MLSVFYWKTVAKNMLTSTTGNVAIVFALLLPVLIGATGLGVETSYWYYRSLQLQSAADSAAYAAELENLSGASTTDIKAAATRNAAQNGFEASSGSIDVHSPPVAGTYKVENASEVILRQDLERYFTAIFSTEPVVLSARAVAKSEVASQACVLALDRSASKALLFSGSSSLSLTGCAVMSNSDADDALKVQGSANLTVSCLISAGGMELTSGAKMTSCSTALENMQAVADPFLDLPTPPTTGSCQNSKSAALQPGLYCSGLTLTGTTPLSPGVYVIDGGDFKVNANAQVLGTGVTIYLACGSTVSMNGNATVQLAAPTSGDYSGVLFYGDRNCQSGSNTFNGTASSLLTGSIYFAHQEVNYLGNFSGSGGCTQIVAGTIQWSGNTTIAQDCTSLGIPDLPANKQITLLAYMCTARRHRDLKAEARPSSLPW